LQGEGRSGTGCETATFAVANRIAAWLEPMMSWSAATNDLSASEAAAAALKEFERARRAGRPSVECYRAGVAAWRRVHPDQSPEYAAKRAVAVILERHVKLRVEE
jgi:hypothetical protein